MRYPSVKNFSTENWKISTLDIFHEGNGPRKNWYLDIFGWIVFWLAGWLLTGYWLTLGWLAVYWLSTDCLLTVYWLSTGCLLTVYWLIGWLLGVVQNSKFIFFLKLFVSYSTSFHEILLISFLVLKGGPNGVGSKFAHSCTFEIVLKCWTFQIDLKFDLKYISNVDFDFLVAYLQIFSVFSETLSNTEHSVWVLPITTTSWSTLTLRYGAKRRSRCQLCLCQTDDWTGAGNGFRQISWHIYLICLVKMGVVQVQRGSVEMGVVQLRVVQMEVDQSSHTVAHLK